MSVHHPEKRHYRTLIYKMYHVMIIHLLWNVRCGSGAMYAMYVSLGVLQVVFIEGGQKKKKKKEKKMIVPAEYTRVVCIWMSLGFLIVYPQSRRLRVAVYVLGTGETGPLYYTYCSTYNSGI